MKSPMESEKRSRPRKKSLEIISFQVCQEEELSMREKELEWTMIHGEQGIYGVTDTKRSESFNKKEVISFNCKQE